MATVLLVRHGRTAWNHERRLQGWAPVSLDERGHEQAVAAAGHLADAYDIDHLESSDLLRTRQTAEYVEAETGRSAVLSPAWRERDVGVYQGLSHGDMDERFPEFGLNETAPYAAGEVPESGESLAEVRDRTVDRWDGLLADLASDETACIVAHGGPIHLLLGHLKGMDIPESILGHSQANCAINEISLDGGAATVVRENATPWE